MLYKCQPLFIPLYHWCFFNFFISGLSLFSFPFLFFYIFISCLFFLSSLFVVKYGFLSQAPNSDPSSTPDPLPYICLLFLCFGFFDIFDASKILFILHFLSHFFEIHLESAIPSFAAFFLDSLKVFPCVKVIFLFLQKLL